MGLEKEEERQPLMKVLMKIQPVLAEESGDVDLDVQEAERDTLNLRDDLNEIDSIEKIELPTKEEAAPKGAKPGGELVEWGSLLVTLATTAGPSFGNLLQSWITRHEKRKIVLEVGGDKLEVTGISDTEQSKIVDAWLRSKLQKKG